MNPYLPLYLAVLAANPAAQPNTTPPAQDAIVMTDGTKVPARYQFKRSLEAEAGLYAGGRQHIGAQSVRIETRYLDPDVNAFVGMGTFATRFNDKFALGAGEDESHSYYIWNWGAALGIVRGRSLWALDLMGVVAGSRVGFGPTIVGEHRLSPRWQVYHRTTGNFFSTDTVLDSDQGVIFAVTPTFHVTGSYRIFAADHISRNGPRIGILMRFDTPNLWFIFPSLG